MCKGQYSTIIVNCVLEYGMVQGSISLVFVIWYVPGGVFTRICQLECARGCISWILVLKEGVLFLLVTRFHDIVLLRNVFQGVNIVWNVKRDYFWVFP